jgi:uncharacterized protein
MRVVLDTNIIVSRALSRHGAPARIVAYWYAHRTKLQVIASPALLAEYERVLSSERVRARHGMGVEYVRGLLDDFRQLGIVVVPTHVPAVIARDPSDDHVLACAVAGNADYIVTGDPHLLDLGEYEGIRILRPAAFLALLDETV